MPAQVEDLNDHQVEAWPSTPEGEARQADEVVRHYRTLLTRLLDCGRAARHPSTVTSGSSTRS